VAGAPELFVGLDLGTTGVRAVVFDRDARQLGEATEEYPLHTPRPGWAEQDPAEVLAGALRCLSAAAQQAGAAGRPLAIGISGTFHSVLPVGHDGAPLGRGMIWADTRAVDESAAIRAEHDAQALYERTGCPVHPMYLPAKIRWLRQHVPEAAAFRSIREQVLLQLTGEWACDLSTASGTGMLNLERKAWDDELLAIAGVRPDQLGPLVESTQVVGRLTPEIANAAGLSAESVVIAGAGDGVLSSLGAGTLESGQMTATVGTSGAVRLVTDRPRVDTKRARTWCYYLAEDTWVAGAAINNAGIAFRWATEKLLRAGESGYEQAASWAESAPAGSDGLLFLPFLTGERAPYWNADARGVMFGLAIGHDHRHVARATLEGVCYRMRSVHEALAEVAGPVHEIRATGGYTKTPFWLQLLADVIQQPLRIPSVQEASALGAAELAMVGTGALASIAETGRFVTVGEPIEPNRANAAVYDRLYDLYMQVYWQLTEQFTAVARFQRESAPE